MICKKCGSEVAEDDVFCMQCGEKIERPQCPHCGAEVDEDTVFAPTAAKRLDRNDAHTAEVNLKRTVNSVFSAVRRRMERSLQSRR